MRNINIDGKDYIVGGAGNVNPAIEWQDGAVCYADGECHYPSREGFVEDSQGFETSFLNIMNYSDFQLNTIKQGDYIEASELDTEQKYNDAVDVLELLGAHKGKRHSYYAFKICKLLKVTEHCSLPDVNLTADCKRKLTFNQLMAIGELKRLEIERDKKEASECFVETLDEKVSRAEKLENEWTDKHYNFNYQLTQEDIEKGHVRVDAYFVNRMWKINQWDDTGAAFHVLKTLPRIANNKNPLKRELVALKKQVDLLCKMHGVDDGDLK